MKAPEKVYIDDFGSGFSHGWHTEHSYERDIEYVRKDAFIDKACVKLKKLMYDNLMFQGRLHREEIINSFIEDFKNYMKGGEE